MSDETQAVLDRVRDAIKAGFVSWKMSEEDDVTFDAHDISHLLATVDALREDARRMDWLETSGCLELELSGWQTDYFRVLQGGDALGQGPTLRDAIDAARVGGQP